ncbi:MAG: adenylosuccinate synthase [Alphaproteobacteria bacterium]|jgi:adenylosuccinate synthase|nr:adenylosuccinate synthase [Alphaproteobacteria bacterium]MBP9877033.1 adenylosuccinate synthase [Alphaproteobacteria bacterium]
MTQTNQTIIGLSWGDEGKGKIVDVLAEKVDYVVRFQGGHNAGHTLVIGDQVLKLSLVPSGIARKGVRSVIGNGVVLDPWYFKEEVTRLKQAGIDVSPERLHLSDTLPFILPFHKTLDQLKERKAGDQKIGTTGRGIGPAYEDKVGRRSIYLMDLKDEKRLEAKLESLAFQHNPFLLSCGEKAIDVPALMADLKSIADFILPYETCVWKLLEKAEKENKRVLFEGAQGILLDNDFGTLPYVTSSNTLPAQIPLGTGASIKQIGHVMGVLKAYVTRVGEGPFPTELFNEEGSYIAKQGHEFGTVTGRPRRCGWFDAVLARQAIRVSSVDSIIITKLDVLDGMKDVKICTHYMVGNQKFDHFSYDPSLWSRLEPIYETLPGWSEPTAHVKSFDQLPENAKTFVNRIGTLCGVPIQMISTGPDRDDVIAL